MYSYFIMGIILGTSAGFSPGPILTLVVSQSLRYGRKEGIKVALSPLITDMPIIAVTLFLLSQIPNLETVLGFISLFGAAFLVYLGYESIRFSGMETEIEAVKPQSLKKGIITNTLNPHPYLFWLTIGSPIVIKASQEATTSAALFLFAFYVCLVGAKIGIAYIIGGWRQFLKSALYVYINRFLGIILWLFAVLFFREGLYYLL